MAIIRTPDQRLRVFVSSTTNELAGERAVARRAIENLRLSPILFELGARPHPPREIYGAYLEQSHIFVAIYWESFHHPAELQQLIENDLALRARLDGTSSEQ
jgi:Domain of unknown function (DUF4062)